MCSYYMLKISVNYNKFAFAIVDPLNKALCKMRIHPENWLVSNSFIKPSQCINCWLVRHQPDGANVAQAVAALASGLAFYLCPSTQLLAHAFATAVELSWSNYMRHSRAATRPLAINWLSRLPIARIFYPLAFAYLVHVRIFYPWLAPAMLRNLMNRTTNYR